MIPRRFPSSDILSSQIGFNKRDISLDFLKGIACILMVIAHSAGVENSALTTIFAGEHDKIVRAIYLVGETAPILFFAVSGIAGYLQAKKYGFKSVAVSYIFLFLLGFSYNGITQRDFYRNFHMEILQIIAVGAFLVFCVQYLNKPAPLNFLWIALFSFSVKWSANHFNWIKDQLSITKGILVPPGTFPLFPWLFLFFLGAFAYIVNNKYNLLLAVTSIGLFVVLETLSITGKVPINLRPTDKWNMSSGYFLLSWFLLFSSFYLIRNFRFYKWKYVGQVILFWGETSLLFLFVHKFVIRLLHRSSALNSYLYGIMKNPILFYFSVLLITTFLMKLILKMQSNTSFNSVFEDIRAWLVLVSLVLIVPLVFRNEIIIYGFELILGVIFATYYASLRKTIKQQIEGSAVSSADHKRLHSNF